MTTSSAEARYNGSTPFTIHIRVSHDKLFFVNRQCKSVEARKSQCSRLLIAVGRLSFDKHFPAAT